MQNEFFTNHIQAFFLGTLLLTVLAAIIYPRKKNKKEKPDPPVIFGSIRGMYVCYQCDTIFNTLKCPVCNEEAVVPLIQLTGSIIEDGRVAAVVGKLQRCSTRKLPPLLAFQDEHAVLPAPASKPANGDATEVPATVARH